MKPALPTLLLVAALSILATGATTAGGMARAADTPPDCTNGDCPPPPPDCTNGDCPPPPDCTNGDCPPPPQCTNGDCPPSEPSDCCCVGENRPGDIRFCCCPSGDLSTLTCRESLVLPTGYPDNWHQTLAQESLDGERPRSCASLVRFCDRPVEQICAKQKSKACPKIVQAACKMIDSMCAYRFCGPAWFPYAEPAPEPASCSWWDRIHRCKGK